MAKLQHHGPVPYFASHRNTICAPRCVLRHTSFTSKPLFLFFTPLALDQISRRLSSTVTRFYTSDFIYVPCVRCVLQTRDGLRFLSAKARHDTVSETGVLTVFSFSSPPPPLCGLSHLKMSFWKLSSDFLVLQVQAPRVEGQ